MEEYLIDLSHWKRFLVIKIDRLNKHEMEIVKLTMMYYTYAYAEL